MASDESDTDRLLGMSCEGCSDDYFMEHDEDGSLALARSLMPGGSPARGGVARDDTTARPCKVGVLNGSWFLQLTPKGPHTHTEIRGPMRIEVAAPKLRISGDIYIRKPAAVPVEILRPITETPLFFGKNWYPQLPIDQYSWYFRSVGVNYNAGKLTFKFERFLWNKTTQEFINQQNSGQDNGFMQLECLESSILNHPLLPQPTLRLTGTAQIGGETYDAVATKTSPFYRGCAVEVDVMTNRQFPLSATTINGTAISFASIYRTAGMDCTVLVDQTNLPEDAELSTIELQTALATNRRPVAAADAWRLWLLVGSSQGSLFGLMFDDTAPFREGTAGFFDPIIPASSTVAPSAGNKKLGDVPEAFLRTLVHEAGHAFNLFHPKHDVHNVPIGTTIMNQTGDVMSFATPTNTYPGNITFAFDDHNRTSLIHSPDPQVAPGWKRFGWGHGSLSSGIAEPVDAAGFVRADDAAGDLTLELKVSENIFRGEFVTAQFIVTNVGATTRKVTSAINLSQGDLRLLVKPPSEELDDVRDVIVACGDRPYVALASGKSLTGNGQIFYTNVGFTFRQTGRYYVSAELVSGDGSDEVVRSGPVAVVVRAPSTAEEEEIARLSMDARVGRAFAFGDYGMDDVAEKNLENLAAKYGHTETGMAASLILANAQSRDLRDLYSGKKLRVGDKKAGQKHFDNAAVEAVKSHPTRLARLASAVVAPVEADAPVLDLAATYLKQSAPAARAAAKGSGAKSKKGKKGKKGKAMAAPVAADAADGYGAGDAGDAGDALNFLNEVRRTLGS
ncbi:MAG: hypothetical protein WCE79_16960 [Xanthobacteraceae bacterium]